METSQERYIDATQLPPATKHQTIFGVFDELKEGESFILHNDHDPIPLRYQITATRGDLYDWDYLQKGPEIWELRITKKINYLKHAIALNEDGETILDATQLPPSIKHDTILRLFDNLKEGKSFILHNDHDPVPLRYQLLALKGETFTWDYILSGPDVFEIRIEKKPDPAKAAAFSVNERGENVLNATKLPPAIKHATILDTFDNLKEGASFILQNDHDPKPLQYQLAATKGEIFTWKYLQQGPVFEIRIGKKNKQ